MNARNYPRTTAPTFVEEYRTVDKSEWGPGPWQDEPDKVVWVDEVSGLDCMIHRGPLGALCGYVGVPEGHVAHGRGYDDVGADVHGGLTYAAACWKVDDPAAADYRRIAREAEAKGDRETAELFGRDLTTPWFGTPVTYKPISYVIAEVERLADQLAEVGALDGVRKEEPGHEH